MARELDTSPTLMPDGTYVWNEERGKDERSLNDCETLTERSQNGVETLPERGSDVGKTLIQRCLNTVGNTLQRLAQTANATQRRKQKLKKAAQIPKQKIYADVCEWLNDDRNIMEATNYDYRSIEEFTDNPPSDVINRLNELGLVPKDKPSEQWSATTLAPVVFHLRLQRRYKPQTVALIHCCWAIALLFGCGFLGSRSWRSPEIAEKQASTMSNVEILNQWEDEHHYYFSPWRRDNIILKQELLQDDFLIKQTKEQGKSFIKPQDRK